MKKIVMLIALLAALLTLTFCGVAPDEPLFGPPGDRMPSDTTPAPTTPASTTSDDNVPDLTNSVTLYNGEGEELPTYQELVCLRDGDLIGDGYLMFTSVPSRLRSIADQIPEVDLGDAPYLLIGIKSWEDFSGAETVAVYAVNGALLADGVLLEDVPARGASEWQGQTVYLYFTFTYSSHFRSDYVKSQTTACFVKTTFE